MVWTFRTQTASLFGDVWGLSTVVDVHENGVSRESSVGGLQLLGNVRLLLEPLQDSGYVSLSDMV